MMRQGPIPLFLHGLLEYVGGIAFLAAPVVLDYGSGAATAISLAFGVAMIVVAASSDGPTGLVSQLPRPAHLVIDLLLAVAAIAMPFLAGFADEREPTAFFMVAGVIYLLVAIGTRFSRPRATLAARGSSHLDGEGDDRGSASAAAGGSDDDTTGERHRSE